jgi:hypothetical protein
MSDVAAALNDLEKIVADDSLGVDEFKAGIQAVWRAARIRQEAEYLRELAAGVSAEREEAIRIWFAFQKFADAGHYARVEPPQVLN